MTASAGSAVGLGGGSTPRHSMSDMFRIRFSQAAPPDQAHQHPTPPPNITKCFFSAFIAANKVHLKMAKWQTPRKFQFESWPKQNQCKGWVHEFRDIAHFCCLQRFMQVLKNHRYSQTKVAQGSMMAKRGTNQVCRLLAPNQGLWKKLKKFWNPKIGRTRPTRPSRWQKKEAMELGSKAGKRSTDKSLKYKLTIKLKLVVFSTHWSCKLSEIIGLPATGKYLGTTRVTLHSWYQSQSHMFGSWNVPFVKWMTLASFLRRHLASGFNVKPYHQTQSGHQAWLLLLLRTCTQMRRLDPEGAKWEENDFAGHLIESFIPQRPSKSTDVQNEIFHPCAKKWLGHCNPELANSSQVKRHMLQHS